MGWRFRKRIKIFPGVHINLSTKGISANIGVKGASVTLGPDGTYVNTGIPGTGLYRHDKVGKSSNNNNSSNSDYSNDYSSHTAPKNEGTTEKKYISVEQKDKLTYSIFKDDFPTYKFPSADLLKVYPSYDDKSVPSIKEEIAFNNNRLVSLLLSFDIRIRAIRATIGPLFTVYEITPEEGIYLSDIKDLEEDIALGMGARQVIIAPIPDKSTIAIAVLNTHPHIVSFHDIVTSPKFEENHMELPCALGRTMLNDVFIFDLAKAPHLLVAGSSGQGKSVALNTIITSLLYSKSPAELKFVLMDPKGVEFGLYEKISKLYLAGIHADVPMVETGEDAVETLEALCDEMDIRLEMLSKLGARNIIEYNRKVKGNTADSLYTLPYIVVLIDSFDALIADCEDIIMPPLTSLLETARAVGIHIVISSNRSSNGKIFSKLLSYMPARICFKVPYEDDSQTILGYSGAEKLLQPGDMLIYNGNELVRLQCSFIDTPETEAVVSFVSSQTDIAETKSNLQCNKDLGYKDINITKEELDPLFEQAARLVVLSQIGSASKIQLQFSIGYNRAGRLMDQLEQAGILGPAQGSKPREVLITDEAKLETLLSGLK